LNCDNTELKRSSKIFSTASLGGSGLNMFVFESVAKKITEIRSFYERETVDTM